VALLAEIADLEKAAGAFTSMLGELDHSARRVADGLERTGGVSADLERKRTTLDRNRRTARADIETARGKLAAARSRLAEIEEKLSQGKP